MTQQENSHEEIYKLVGRRIRAERTACRMSQQDLAEFAHLTRTSIVNIEKGRQKILIHTLILIAQALKVPPTRLLGGLGEPEESVLLQEIPETVAPNVREWIIKSVRRASSTTKSSLKE